MIVRNKTCYPDRLVKALIAFAVVELELPEGLPVEVLHTRQSTSRVLSTTSGQYWLNAYSGMAYWGGAVPWRLRSRVPYAMSLRIGRPECFPMRRATQYRTWCDDPANPPRPGWPVWKHESWEECLVMLAAHEARHVEGFQPKHKYHGEESCEAFARYMVDRYLGFRGRLEMKEAA